MAWLRQIGLEFGQQTDFDKTDRVMEHIESDVENSPVGSSKNNGIVERAIQSVQGMIRTRRSAIEEKCVKIAVTHSVSPWIAS